MLLHPLLVCNYKRIINKIDFTKKLNIKTFAVIYDKKAIIYFSEYKHIYLFPLEVVKLLNHLNIGVCRSQYLTKSEKCLYNTNNTIKQEIVAMSYVINNSL